MSVRAESPASVVARLLAEERFKLKQQEWRVRCYAEVLVLYAHRLAIAQDKHPGKVIREAREEVQARLKERDWLML
jgi:hypothetical protein